ncbi:hypothetical protein OH76DRAFT_1351381 [Lentinus brumalis]|uniref:BTB domain-containing protein n=1 Tax=Lentinus brumalis TaxID=2498619 RepID=A0A371D8T1_9APHY|nr:hypothetical protein OH76DRAFT_1351381 [Polyporus brumalis]
MTEGSSPPTCSPTINEDEGLAHDAEYWLDDGNIILIARDIVFRIYRGLLAAQSPVFAAMFSSRSGEVCEETPIFHLSDSPEDFRHFLHVVLPQKGRHFYGEEPHLTFDQVSAVIRLAHKYHVEDIERQALSALKAYYTDDFDEYDQRDDEDIDSLPVAFADTVPHAIAAINLARLTDTPTVLPLAFYRCSNLGSNVLDGYRRDDNSVEYLSPADLKRCMEGRNALGREALKVILRIFRDESCDGCRTPHQCRAELRLMLVDNYECATDCNVLGSWNIFIHGAVKDRKLCDDCKEALEARDYEERRGLWFRLPDIFDLNVKG